MLFVYYYLHIVLSMKREQLDKICKKYSIPTPTHAIIVELTKGMEDVRCLKQE